MAYYRAGYHHGDARAALLRAAFNLARGGGPPTVTLRAAAREVGITAAAVYRHFTTVEELLGAVKCRTLRMLAERMDDAVSLAGAAPASGSGHDSGHDHDSEPDSDFDHDSDYNHDSGSDRDRDRDRDHERTIGAAGDAAALRERIRAVADGYVSFAREYPGLFAMACHGGVDEAVALVAERVGDVPHTTGLAVWSAAHGMAVLAVSEADEEHVLDLVLAGIAPA
jgi:AcrR family transcriptional regulator